MTDDSLHYPRSICCHDLELELRLMAAGDEASALAFANALPAHDLLFLQRDIRQAKVVSAWIEQIERGYITSHLALANGRILGCTAIVRDAAGKTHDIVILSLEFAKHRAQRLAYGYGEAS